MSVLAIAAAGVFFTLPPIWVIPFLNWAAYVTYGGWPLLLALPVTTVWPAWLEPHHHVLANPSSHPHAPSQMKFLVFPFFLPCVLFWVVYMLAKLKNTWRAVFAVFLAMQASVFLQMEERATADVGSWGLQGPCKDCPIPSLGVWHFQGLPGAGFIDFSHCEWTGEGGLLTPARTAYCHMPGLISYPKEGYNILAEQRRLRGAKWLDVTADFGSTGEDVHAFYEIAPWHLNMGLLFYRTPL